MESVDGDLLEDVTITNITMREIPNAPIFMRLGFRGRGPKETTTVGALRRIIISNVVVYDAGANISSIISGIPGHPIEDVTLSNIKIYTLVEERRRRLLSNLRRRKTPIPNQLCLGTLRHTASLFGM